MPAEWEDAVGPGSKARKPYTITKQRERWTDDEHYKFLEALRLYGRAWRKIEEYIGTKTAVQIRSHAQKFFSKLERKKEGADVPAEQAGDDIDIPPPRPKRKPVRPYPKKETTENSGLGEVSGTVTSSGYNNTRSTHTTNPLIRQQPQSQHHSHHHHHHHHQQQQQQSQQSQQQQQQQQQRPHLYGAQGLPLHHHGGSRSPPLEVTEATVAAVAAAASAAAAAAAAAVVAAAGQQVQAYLQINPPAGFPFFGMPPSMMSCQQPMQPAAAPYAQGKKPTMWRAPSESIDRHASGPMGGMSLEPTAMSASAISRSSEGDSACSREVSNPATYRQQQQQQDSGEAAWRLQQHHQQQQQHMVQQHMQQLQMQQHQHQLQQQQLSRMHHKTEPIPSVAHPQQPPSGNWGPPSNNHISWPVPPPSWSKAPLDLSSEPNKIYRPTASTPRDSSDARGANHNQLQPMHHAPNHHLRNRGGNSGDQAVPSCGGQQQQLQPQQRASLSHASSGSSGSAKARSHGKRSRPAKDGNSGAREPGSYMEERQDASGEAHQQQQAQPRHCKAVAQPSDGPNKSNSSQDAADREARGLDVGNHTSGYGSNGADGGSGGGSNNADGGSGGGGSNGGGSNGNGGNGQSGGGGSNGDDGSNNKVNGSGGANGSGSGGNGYSSGNGTSKGPCDHSRAAANGCDPDQLGQYREDAASQPEGSQMGLPSSSSLQAMLSALQAQSNLVNPFLLQAYGAGAAQGFAAGMNNRNATNGVGGGCPGGGVPYQNGGALQFGGGPAPHMGSHTMGGENPYASWQQQLGERGVLSGPASSGGGFPTNSQLAAYGAQMPGAPPPVSYAGGMRMPPMLSYKEANSMVRELAAAAEMAAAAEVLSHTAAAARRSASRSLSETTAVPDVATTATAATAGPAASTARGASSKAPPAASSSAVANKAQSSCNGRAGNTVAAAPSISKQPSPQQPQAVKRPPVEQLNNSAKRQHISIAS